MVTRFKVLIQIYLLLCLDYVLISIRLPTYLFSKIFSCSTDKTVGVWDVSTGVRVKKFKGHSLFVNSVSPTRRGNEILASGSDDGSIKVIIVIIIKSTDNYKYILRKVLLLHKRYGIFVKKMQLKHSFKNIRSLPLVLAKLEI